MNSDEFTGPLMSELAKIISSRGQWGSFCKRYAPELTEAIDNAGRHVPCPESGQGKDNFRVMHDFDHSGVSHSNWIGTSDISLNGIISSGFNLVGWVRNCSKGEVYKYALEFLGMSLDDSTPTKPVVAKKRKLEKPKIKTCVIETNKLLWRESFSMCDPRSSIARRYLVDERGLNLSLIQAPSDYEVRFHPRVIRDFKTGECSPAILLRIARPDGMTVGLHRIFLDEQGRKADLDDPRKMTSRIYHGWLRGAAIRLYSADNRHLGLCEGYEDAMAIKCGLAKLNPDLPMWATINRTMLESVYIPRGIEVVNVFMDLDTPSMNVHSKTMNTVGDGEISAWRGKIYYESLGLKVNLFRPPELEKGKKSDWNIVFNELGASGFADLKPLSMSERPSDSELLIRK